MGSGSQAAGCRCRPGGGSRRGGWHTVLQALVEQIVCGSSVTYIVALRGVGALVLRVLGGLNGLGEAVGSTGRIGGNVVDHRDISLSLQERERERDHYGSIRLGCTFTHTALA